MFAAATAPDGRIFAMGGTYNQAGMTQNASLVESYDPNTDQWQTVASMPTGRASLAATTALDGRIFALGGSKVDDNGHWTPLKTAEVYDPKTNAWQALSTMSVARSSLAAATAADGRIFVFGGLDANRQALSTTEAYDPKTNQWKTVAKMPTPRQLLAAATASDGRIFVFGGASGNGPSSNTYLSTVEAYNPATDQWQTVAQLPLARGGLAAVNDSKGNLFVLGGRSTINTAWVVDVYAPSTNQWKSGTHMIYPRNNLAAATAVDGRIFVFGGNEDSILPSVEVYTP